MESYADAVVGIVGEGLNVEQRKRLTIGVELAAKPQLLLFLDEVRLLGGFDLFSGAHKSRSLLRVWTPNLLGRLSSSFARSLIADKPSCARESQRTALKGAGSDNSVTVFTNRRLSSSRHLTAFSCSAREDRPATLVISGTTPEL
jgi:hypothetical protein